MSNYDKEQAQAIYRKGVEPMPAAMYEKPIVRGYPVPWFVAKIPGRNEYDFRIMEPRKFKKALDRRLCWVCGEPLSGIGTFVVGPMCTINEISAEPPSHPECARWSARVCPFLLQKMAARRSNDLPDHVRPAGDMIERQPGVAALWHTNNYKPVPAPGGILVHMGAPKKIDWVREGRSATREEVLESITSGYPELLKACETLGDIKELARKRDWVIAMYVPKE